MRITCDKNLLYKQKRTTTTTTKKKKNSDDQNAKNSNRLLITVDVSGSTGPIRFVVNSDDNAAVVIQTALKLYAREGRLPILGSDINSFFLYPANAGLAALKPSDAIGSPGVRKFVLHKRENKSHMTHEARSQQATDHGWLRRSLRLKILSHYIHTFIFSKKY